jgi:hypothetical protein
VNATEAAPLLYARLEPASVAVGALGVAGTVVAVIDPADAELPLVAVALVEVTAMA